MTARVVQLQERSGDATTCKMMKEVTRLSLERRIVGMSRKRRRVKLVTGTVAVASVVSLVTLAIHKSLLQAPGIGMMNQHAWDGSPLKSPSPSSRSTFFTKTSWTFRSEGYYSF